MFVRFQFWNKFEHFLKKSFLVIQYFPIFPFLQYKNGTIFFNQFLSANIILIHRLRKCPTCLTGFITGHRPGRRKRCPRNNVQARDTRAVIITKNKTRAHLIITRKENLLLWIETESLEPVNSSSFECARWVAQTRVLRVKTTRIKIRKVSVPATLSRLWKIL